MEHRTDRFEHRWGPPSVASRAIALGVSLRPNDAYVAKRRNSARWPFNRHHPSGLDSSAAVHRRTVRPTLWGILGTGSVAAAECSGALSSALETAPSLLASINPHIFRRQRMPSPTAVRDTLPPDLA